MNITSKIAALGLAAVTVVGTIATPVLAGDSVGFDSSFYVAQLRYDGVNAIDANEGWNGSLVATVKLDDGRTVYEFFDKSSLQPISIGR